MAGLALVRAAESKLQAKSELAGGTAPLVHQIWSPVETTSRVDGYKYPQNP